MYNYIRFTWFFAASYSIGAGEGKSAVTLATRRPNLTESPEILAELAQPLLLDTKKLIERAQAKWPEQMMKVMDEYEHNPLEPAMLQEAKVRIMGASLGFTTVLTPAYRWTTLSVHREYPQPGRVRANEVIEVDQFRNDGCRSA